MSRAGLVRCAAAAALFGASAPLASRLAQDMGAFTLAGLLYVGAALAVGPFVARRPPTRAGLARGGVGLGIAVVAGGGIAPVLLAAGLARTPAATASLLLNFELVATAVLAAVLFREHIGGRVAAGTALVVLGGLVLGSSGAPDLRIGAAAILAACAFWGIDNCVTAQLDELAPEHITLAKGLIAGATNLALGLSLGSLPPLADVGAALAIGALGYGASITLWVAGARELGAARGQLVFATAPFIGTALAWTVLGDPATSAEVIAIVLAGAGVVAVLGSDHAHEHAHPAVEHDHAHRHDDAHHRHSHVPGAGAVGAGTVHAPTHGRLARDGGVVTHRHRHRHSPLVHAHPHLPDIHHRHAH